MCLFIVMCALVMLSIKATYLLTYLLRWKVSGRSVTSHSAYDTSFSETCHFRQSMALVMTTELKATE